MGTRFFHRSSIHTIIYLSMLTITNFNFFIQPTPGITDTPEAEMPYEEAVNTMGDDIMDKME